MENNTREFKVIELEKFGARPKMGTRPFRPLKKGEALIKIAMTTIHPADLMFLMGEYGDDMKPKVFPLVPGFEASGEIVSVWEGGDSNLLKKRVCVTSPFKKDGTFDGVWAEYHYASVNSLMIFDSNIEYEKITFAQTNPLTAIGFLDTVRKSNSKSVLQDGASGAFGKMFIRLCAKEGLTSINLVRSKKHTLDLQKLGADYVISTEEPKWENALAKLTHELNTSIFFDCVGGNLPGKIFSMLPKGSVMYNFGNLELKKVGVDSASLIFQDKRVHGWWLFNWFKTLTPEEKAKWWSYVVKDISSGSDLFLSQTSKDFSLKQINEALEYYQKNMSEGKVVLRPKF